MTSKPILALHLLTGALEKERFPVRFISHSFSPRVWEHTQCRNLQRKTVCASSNSIETNVSVVPDKGRHANMLGSFF